MLNKHGDGIDYAGMTEKAERERVPQRFERDPVKALGLAIKEPCIPPTEEPRDLEGLLTRQGVEVGPFPGNAAVLAGAGGAGKSAAALALAVQVAGGPSPGCEKWCGFKVEAEGPVLYIAAEDAWETVNKRQFQAWKELTPEQVQRASKRFHMLSLVGRDRQLVQTFRVTREMTVDEAGRAGVEPRVVERNGVEVQTFPMVSEVLVGPSAFFEALGRAVAKLRPALVVLDPLAAFDCGEVETDNGAAGKFMAMLQGLAEQAKAVVLLVHHTTKGSRDGSKDAAATNVRGSSALTDNARWVAELKFDDDDALTLNVTKNNNGKPFDETVYLTRVSAGVLRAERPDEAAEREKLAFNRKVSEAVEKNAFDARLKAAIATAMKGEQGNEEKPKRGADRYSV